MHVFERWEEAGVPGELTHTRGEHANSTQKNPNQDSNLFL